MGRWVIVEAHLHTTEARNAIYDAALAAMRESFEGSILADAKANSPVEPIAHPAGSIHNRDSLQVKVFGTKRGPFAKLFSTSGHGGFLEVGTKNMSAQPYIWPAFQMNLGRLMESIREKIQAIKIDNKQAAEVSRVLPEE